MIFVGWTDLFSLRASPIAEMASDCSDASNAVP
jgi:hypothetical protein